tara:strand:- start:262 stop:1146 length:885 start_codon:yes stop_codon:yes gene_type:complete
MSLSVIKNSSNSQHATHAGCGMKWYYDKVRGLPFKAGAGLLVGKGLDDTTASSDGYFGDIIRHGQPAKDYKQYFADQTVKQGLETDTSHWDEKDKEDYAKAVDNIAKLIPQYCHPESEHHRTLDPEAIQHPIMLHLRDLKLPIKGFIDLLAYDREDKRFKIIDIKSAGRAMNLSKIDYKMQIALYSFAIMQEKNLSYLPAGEVHGFVWNLKTPKIEVIKFDVDEDLVSQVLMRALNFEWAVSNSYFPMARNSPLCSVRYCSHYEICHEENQRNLPTLLRMLKPKVIGSVISKAS